MDFDSDPFVPSCGWLFLSLLLSLYQYSNRYSRCMCIPVHLFFVNDISIHLLLSYTPSKWALSKESIWIGAIFTTYRYSIPGNFSSRAVPWKIRLFLDKSHWLVKGPSQFIRETNEGYWPRRRRGKSSVLWKCIIFTSLYESSLNLPDKEILPVTSW